MTTSDPPAPEVDPSRTAEIAIVAAVAATSGEPVTDPRRPARRAVAVIDAIRAHRPSATPRGAAAADEEA